MGLFIFILYLFTINNLIEFYFFGTRRNIFFTSQFFIFSELPQFFFDVQFFIQKSLLETDTACHFLTPLSNE